jgi:hypothetical protein
LRFPILIDAAQAQGIAKGLTKEPISLPEAEYRAEVIKFVKQLLDGGTFGIGTCDEERRVNPFRTLNLFSVESINGFTKISELLSSVANKSR